MLPTDLSEVRERFEAKVYRIPGECWVWVACTHHPGYGLFRFAGRTQRAHRVAWKIYRGPIPEALCVLHRCDNPSCVNPEHLWLGTIQDNNVDMARKGRSTAGRGCLPYGVARQSSGRFKAQIGLNGKKHSLGTYDTAEQAHEAAALAAQGRYVWPLIPKGARL